MDYYCLSYGEFCLNHSHLHSTVTKTLLDFVRRLRCCLEGHRIFAVFPFASCNSRPCFRRRIYGHRRLLMADRDDGERGGLTATAPRHLLSLYIARPRLLAYAVAGRERMRLRRGCGYSFFATASRSHRSIQTYSTPQLTRWGAARGVASSSFANSRRAVMQKQPSQKSWKSDGPSARLYVPCDCEGLAGCRPNWNGAVCNFSP